MADPQEPDPKRRWCRKCRRHGKFIKKKRYNNSTSTSYKVSLCTRCNRDGFVPCNLKKDAIKNAKIFGIILLALNCLFLFSSVFKIGLIESLTGFFSCSLILTLPVVAYFWLHLLPYLDWKKWAKERGWEGE